MIVPVYKNALGKKHQIARALFSLAWTLLARPLPRSIGSGWKRCIINFFSRLSGGGGGGLARTARVYSTCRIFYPANLEMREYSCLASDVECYNVDKITIGAHATVSQRVHLCTASHDYTRPEHPLVTAPIVIGDRAWIGADAFIGMGVTIGEGAVVGARAAVFKDVEPWTVVGGNPARFIKRREMKEESE
jgi:putative colanic acid biosynthesis acetyltransferase WcaF